MIQVPAYLCRQTHILQAAGDTGKPVHLKKGQFMSPWNMKNSARKIERTGNSQILLTDRGTFFGYNMLVNDYRNFPIMLETGYPVCFDATHSVQLPTSMGNISGGQREFIPYLARAAAACGTTPTTRCPTPTPYSIFAISKPCWPRRRRPTRCGSSFWKNGERTVSTSTTNGTIEHILLLRADIPVMPPDTLLKEALEMMTDRRLGIACVVDAEDRLIGIFTDGDLRRVLLRSQKPLSALFADDIVRHARSEFTTIKADVGIAEAVHLLEQREIWDLPVVDDDNRLVGLIHLHPALRALMAE